MSSLLVPIIFFSALGLVGGIVGTYFSIKNTSGPQERAFMIHFAAMTWIGVTLFLVVMFLVPHPFKWFLWIPYLIALLLGIRWGNRQQARIRAEEGRRPPGAPGA